MQRLKSNFRQIFISKYGLLSYSTIFLDFIISIPLLKTHLKLNLTSSTHMTFSKAILIFTTLVASFYTVLAQDANSNKMLEIVNKLGMAFCYPNNTKEAESINSTLFADNVQGRVDLTNTFDGRELNTEYVFGLFATIAHNDTFSLLPVPISSEPRGFISSENFASASALITFKHIATGIEIPMIIDTWIHVNDEGKIDQYEATFKRHDWFFDTFYDLLTPYVAASMNISVDSINDTYRETLFKQLIAQSVCKIHEEYCLGENRQYDSYESCTDFFMSIPFGKSYALGQDNAICRMLHQEMVPSRPEVHCPHIGPSGGMMCVKRNYTEVTEEVYFRKLLINS